jgi:hypothetical protein
MSSDEAVIVDPKDLDETWQFQASLSNHPIVRFPDGHLRYKKSNVDVEYDMNQLWREYHQGMHTREWMMQLYRNIGYSLSGYEEVWGGELNAMLRQAAFKRPMSQIRDTWANIDLWSSCISQAKELAFADEINIEDERIISLIELLRLVARKLEP